MALLSENTPPRLALVTGGTRGIGAAIAVALQQAGYRVVVSFAQDSVSANAFAAAHDIPAYAWDVADPVACQRQIAAITQAHGPIAVLVHNAGITRDGFLHKASQNAWDAVISTNLSSCFAIAKAVIPGMREAGYGRFVAISSINGFTGQLGQTNYAAAKAGLVGFCRALALENAAKGITANVVAPGYIKTAMTDAVPHEVLETIVHRIPVGRLGRPEEIARAVCFLASEDAGFITGTTLHVNGGQYMG